MSTIIVANVVFESTGNNRIQYTSPNQVDIFVGGSSKMTINTTSAKISNVINGQSNVGIYTANGTWTKPSDLQYIKVTVIGGGGGSAGHNGPFFANPGAGGAGGVGVSFIPGPTLPGPQTITVGLGGAGGPAPPTSPSATAGSDGTNSSFGSIVIATGGTGGNGTVNGTRGTSSNATFDYPSTPGAGFLPPSLGGPGAAVSNGPIAGNAGGNGAVIIEEYY